MRLRRREFLMGAAAVTGFVSRLRAEGTTRRSAQGANQARLDRVAIMSANFDKALKVGAGAPSDAARTLDVMDLAQMIADRFGVHRIELEHAHFLSTEAAYLKDLKDRVAKAKSQITQINTEFQGSNASAGGFSARAQAIDLAKQWIDHAQALGCPRVMVNPGTLAENARTNAIEALKIMGEYGRAGKVTVSIENRDNGAPPPAPPPPPPAASAVQQAAQAGAGRGGGGGTPAVPPTWQVVVDVAKAAGIMVTPNVGYFPNEIERAAGLKAMFALMPGTTHCAVDAAKYSFANAIKISKDAAYKGLYAIGTGGAADPYAATKAVLDELLKNI